jgi:endogenous inhibitor of DNA gyrase (YacG/DUF329 family)
MADRRKVAEQKSTRRCPICGKPTERSYRPFCSKRCAEIDLGRWLKGSYAVPGEPVGKIDRPHDADWPDKEGE